MRLVDNNYIDYKKGIIGQGSKRKPDKGVMRAKVRLQLINALTGHIEKDLMTENIYNAFYDKISGIDGSMFTMPADHFFATGNGVNFNLITSDPFAYLFLTSDATPESANENFIKGNIIGRGTRAAPYSGSDVSMGSFNTTESITNLPGKSSPRSLYTKWVYDFPTSAANGTFQKLYWSHTNFGLETGITPNNWSDTSPKYFQFANVNITLDSVAQTTDYFPDGYSYYAPYIYPINKDKAFIVYAQKPNGSCTKISVVAILDLQTMTISNILNFTGDAKRPWLTATVNNTAMFKVFARTDDALYIYGLHNVTGGSSLDSGIKIALDGTVTDLTLETDVVVHGRTYYDGKIQNLCYIDTDNIWYRFDKDCSNLLAINCNTGALISSTAVPDAIKTVYTNAKGYYYLAVFKDYLYIHNDSIGIMVKKSNMSIMYETLKKIMAFTGGCPLSTYGTTSNLLYTPSKNTGTTVSFNLKLLVNQPEVTAHTLLPAPVTKTSVNTLKLTYEMEFQYPDGL